VREANPAILEYYEDMVLRQLRGEPEPIDFTLRDAYDEKKEEIRLAMDACRQCGRPTPRGVDAGPLGRFCKPCWERLQHREAVANEPAVLQPKQRPRMCVNGAA
jgi:hypothetical protein